MTRRISLVAICCSSAAARRFSRSRGFPTESLGGLRTAGRLAPTLPFLVFPKRSISFSLLSQRAIDDRLGESSHGSKHRQERPALLAGLSRHWRSLHANHN